MADNYHDFADPSCPKCLGLVKKANGLALDHHNMEIDLKLKRRRISDLEARLHKQEEQVVVDEQIRRIFELFRIIRGKTQAFKLDKKRRELIATLLNLGYEEMDFRRAFMGVPIRAEKHPDGDKHYTLNFVCQDADTLEKFRDAYLADWAQYDVPFERVDHERLDRFARGEDPASQVSGDTNVVEFVRKRKAA